MLGCNAQYSFSGQISPNADNKKVYLSIIENYRKSSRVYADQVLLETNADAEGNFIFEGNNLSSKNNMYRIHTDDCNEDNKGGSHFFRNCASSRSILFLAKKGDTILFPLLQNNQSFCDITSNNPKSGILLIIDELKEEMILDFMEYQSDASITLNLKKWFRKLQDFSMKTKEPLAELYVYDFLSDRKNETYTFFLKDLNTNEYYTELEKRLISAYPNRKFTSQYIQERKADTGIQLASFGRLKGTHFNYLWYGGGLFLICIIGYYGLQLKKRKIGKKALKNLTPQELTILDAIKKDKTNKEIANELFISHSTVKTHINNIYKKLGANTRSDLKDMF